jgi:hypothetical protein
MKHYTREGRRFVEIDSLSIFDTMQNICTVVSSFAMVVFIAKLIGG